MNPSRTIGHNSTTVIECCIYTKIYNNSKDPTDIEEWKNGTSFIRISEFIKPDILDLEITQNILR